VSCGVHFIHENYSSSFHSQPSPPQLTQYLYLLCLDLSILGLANIVHCFISTSHLQSFAPGRLSFPLGKALVADRTIQDSVQRCWRESISFFHILFWTRSARTGRGRNWDLLCPKCWINGMKAIVNFLNWFLRNYWFRFMVHMSFILKVQFRFRFGKSMRFGRVQFGFLFTVWFKAL
jgi:hypothetical protein